MPIVISYTTETDDRLTSGMSLKDALKHLIKLRITIPFTLCQTVRNRKTSHLNSRPELINQGFTVIERLKAIPQQKAMQS